MGVSMRNAVVLDIASGRGGDINKVQACKAYYGVDVAEDALAELRRRAREIRMSDARVHTWHGDAIQCTWTGLRANLVMCNFALHYFCGSESDCRSLMEVVCRNVCHGGVFMGVYFHVGNDDTKWGETRVANVGRCVQGVREYIVPWKRVVHVAAAFNLMISTWTCTGWYRHADRSCTCFAFTKMAAR